VVDVKRPGGRGGGAGGGPPADAEEHLLSDAAIRGGIVEATGDPLVALVHGLEQIQRRDGVASDLPHAALDLSRAHSHAHAHPCVLERARRMVAPGIVRVAVGTDALDGVALPPAEADAHHREAEITRRLHEVASEDAEAARIRGELLVESVLHREVGHERRHEKSIRQKAAGRRALPYEPSLPRARGAWSIIPPMTTTQLASKRHAVQDLNHAIEFCYQQ